MVFFFKQKTAYEIYQCDWSSDVCSSDLVVRRGEHGLSERQLQIVTLVAQGKKNREISREVGISVRTVEAHRARIMARVGVKNAAELAAWFQVK